MKNNICFVAFSTFVWIVLCERFSVQTAVAGIAVSIGCLIYCRRILSELNLGAVSFRRLAFYPFFLIKEIYISGISAIKRIILADENVEIVKISTQIKSDFLKILLSNSITLTPGTISLNLEDDKITVLWLHSTTDDSDAAGDIIKGRLERKILKAQK